MSVPSCGMERCEAALPPSESGRWPSETMSRADMLRIAVVRSSVSVVVFVFNTLLLLSKAQIAPEWSMKWQGVVAAVIGAR